MLPAPELLKRLPLALHQPEILQRLELQRNLLLTAPTGTGKSSLLPWILHGGGNRVAVLQPRRIAALSLCNFLARCMGEDSGNTVGYSFRFETRVSQNTKILFQTYGSFLQQALRGGAKDFDWIVFDEFHERRAEMDILLAWLLQWQKQDPQGAPRLAVLSAELNRESLESLMGIPCLKVQSPGFPVQTLYQDPKPSEALDQQVLRAVRTLQGNGIWNTTLVFLPGKGEIQSCAHVLEEQLSRSPNAPAILKLFGGQEVVEQANIFADTDGPRIILCTNIAETSLTIPQVTAVIDSGYERSTEFDHARNIQVLRLNRIAMQNAIQRTGRAGRTRPGVCIRLWGERDEAAMPKEIVPEVLRCRLQVPLLQRAGLGHLLRTPPATLAWISSPQANVLQNAERDLEANEFTQGGEITSLGRDALGVPVQALAVARMLLTHPDSPPLMLAAAAWIDAGNESGGSKDSQNLLDLSEELVRNNRGIPREIQLQYQRLCEWHRHRKAPSANPEPRDYTLRALLRCFSDNLATLSESGKAYRIGEQTTILLEPKHTGNAPAVIAFNLLRSGSGKLQQISRCLFAPIPEFILHQGQQAEEHWELLWRNGQERFTGLCIKTLHGREIDRRDIAPQDAPPHARKKLAELTVAAWSEKMKREDLSHLWMSDSIKTLLAKMKWAHKHFPEYSLPEWNAEDWSLVMDELTTGIFLQRDLSEQRFRNIIEDYFNKDMLPWLHKTFPETLRMPNGRMGKYHYPEPEEGPIEICARVADFFGWNGEHTIAEGRIKVRFDLLAPNYRTVQKTWDLAGFWKNTYAEVRKELRGRYPKHPWPEDPTIALTDR